MVYEHLSLPAVASPIFKQLAEKDQELVETVESLHQACADLAARNGEGEPIRRRIRLALQQSRSVMRGASR